MPFRELPETTGPLADRKDSRGRRRLSLNDQERQEMQKSLMLDRLVLMYLDIERKWTSPEMAEELGITVPQLHNLTRTQGFEERWNEHFLELGRDPRIRVTQARIPELLPAAFLTMQKALLDDDVPWTARTRMVEKVLELAGIEKPKAIYSDRKEYEEYMKERGQENVVISIPAQFAKTMRQYKGEDIIEGEVTEIDPTSDSNDPEDPES